MAKGGSIMDEQLNKGEQNDFPLTIRPNQSLLVEELKSKFEDIDRRFDTLFERMNNNGNAVNSPVPKTDFKLILNLFVSKFLTFQNKGLVDVLRIILN